MKHFIVYLRYQLCALLEYITADSIDKSAFKRCALIVNAFVDEECEKLAIDKPYIVILRIDRDATGFCRGGYLICIDPLKGDDYLRTLRHELRHVWQWRYRKGIMDWTIQNLDHNVYDEYFYNPTEIDARHYAKFHEDCGIMDVPVEMLNKLKENGGFVNQMKAVFEHLYHGV